MVKLIGNDILRSGEKIGWVEGNRIRAHDGKLLGYFEDRYVYSEDNRKLAYMEGNRLCSGNTNISLEKVNEAIEGGLLPEVGKCAIYVLLGG